MLKQLFFVYFLLLMTCSVANTERDPQLQQIFNQGIEALNQGDYQSATEYFELFGLNKLWQINNIAPKLTIGKTKNRSNIDNYGKSEPYIKLGFTQQF